MNKKINDLAKRLETEINKTPTGDLRNLLCDANIIIQTLIDDDDIEISPEQIDDLMVTAFEGGINYWCGRVIIKDGSVPIEHVGSFKYASEVISLGGTLILEDVENDDTWELTKEKFLKGLEKTLEWGNYKSVQELCDNHDAETADVLIQYALFDEIVFG